MTVSDFEELAKQAGNVRRAKALPLYHPRFPGTKIPGVVTVIVVPDNDQPNPTPSEATIRLVCAYLNQRRLLTTELYVIPPSYVRSIPRSISPSRRLPTSPTSRKQRKPRWTTTSILCAAVRTD